ncbi:MAG: ATP-dependent Clp protease ATP-binding subunit [Candidatus Woykebacteria bacterium]
MSKKVTEKFTERAKKVLGKAAKEAKSLGTELVDTEHILLGILADGSSVAYKVLASFQVDGEKIKESVLSSTDSQESAEKRRSDGKDEGFTESAQEAIATAALQAYLWGSAYVGTEHLLCGLAKTPSGLACHILRSWGITYDSLKGRVENYTPIQPQPTIVKEPTTPLLNTYGRDLTNSARKKELDPVLMREPEITRVLQVLSRRIKNNPVLLGNAGVGKTAIVEGLAQRIVQKEVPQKFFDTRLISLDINALVAGTRFRGDFEERLLGIIDEIKEGGNVILFIDEIQTIVGAGGAGGALDAANILKPTLARGELRCIGATTAEEYAEYIEEDAALERRFQPIYVEEPDAKTTVSILEGLKHKYESYHGVRIRRNAIEAAVKLAQRYLVDRHLPDSAIDILDEASSKKTVTSGDLSKTAAKISDKLEKLKTEKDQLVKNEIWFEADNVREKEKNYSDRLQKILNRSSKIYSKVVEEKDITEVVSTITGIPIEELTTTEAQRLLDLEKQLATRVVGQNHVLRQVAGVLRRNRVGLRSPTRPAGSFIFLGTSGVGKTLVAQRLAEILFNTPENFIRLDMSEFSEHHTVARLIGAPPGYVGYEEGGELTEKLRRKPYSVVLFDEIEKAHPEVFNILLQVLDDGHLVDGKGRNVNFRNTLIIMTSNVGSHLIRKEGNVGFTSSSAKAAEKERFRDISQKLNEELRRVFKIEFLNRLDSVVVFRPLSTKNVKQIAKILVKEAAKRLKEEHGMKLVVDKKVYDFLVEKGFSEEFGARELQRVITETIEDPLSESILSTRPKKGDSVQVTIEKGQITVK